MEGDGRPKRAPKRRLSKTKPSSGVGAATPDTAENSTFSVLVFACYNPINLTKAVREVTGLGLAESTALVRNLPAILADDVSWDRATELAAFIRRCGGLAEVRPYGPFFS